MEIIPLIFKAKYKVYGENRRSDDPVILKIRMIHTFSIKSEDYSLETLKSKMKETVKQKYGEKARNTFYDVANESIWKEEIKIYDVREVTKWTDLEDFDGSE